ncbi:hypothetical protein VTI74DRAFT_2446 [Chaetomium olivicolor]
MTPANPAPLFRQAIGKIIESPFQEYLKRSTLGRTVSISGIVGTVLNMDHRWNGGLPAHPPDSQDGSTSIPFGYHGDNKYTITGGVTLEMFQSERETSLLRGKSLAFSPSLLSRGFSARPAVLCKVSIVVIAIAGLFSVTARSRSSMNISVIRLALCMSRQEWYSGHVLEDADQRPA